MSCYDGEKGSLEGACGGAELSGCAAAMEKESSLSFGESNHAPPSSSPSPSPSSGLPGGVQPDMQGYDVEFDPPLESKYECPICLMALRDAVQTPCGHRFCHGCITKSIRDAGQKCPVDNEMLTEKQLFPDNFAKREILSLTVRCPNSCCGHKMELRGLEAHVEQCQFATVPCPLCHISVWKNMLDEHQTHECSRRTVSCPDCMQPSIFEESQVHRQVCPLANVVCEYCGMELIRDQLASHLDTDCHKAPVACTFSFFGCQERMLRNDLAQHMQEFTQMHMRNLAEFLRSQNLREAGPMSSSSAGLELGLGLGLGSSGAVSSASCVASSPSCAASSPSCTLSPASCASGPSPPCGCTPELQHMRETVQQLEARLVRQDHQLRELRINSDTQAAQLAELRQQTRKLEARQSLGVYVWRVEGFSAHLRAQEAGQPVVIHSPGFYTGRPGYNFCLRLHLQTPSAPRCSNYISLFVHTMQGEYDGQLSWPFQGTIKLAVLDQAEGPHHEEVMETKPELLAFQRPTSQRNVKGFGYITFMRLAALREGCFVRDDTLLVRCEVTPRFDGPRRDGVLPRGSEASL